MRISVIVPCYNAEKWIAATLRSVLNQTCQPEEIIVVDDGSSDDSRAIAQAFAPAVRVLAQANAGAAAARLAGFEAARGDALMFLDADDLLGPDALAGLAAVLDDHPDAVAICPWMRFEQPRAGVWIARPPSCAPRRPWQDDLSAWLSGWYAPPCAVLWSRAAYDNSGGWDRSARLNDDGDLMMRGLIRGNRLIESMRGTAYYRRLPEGDTSLSGTQRSDAGVAARLDVLDRLSAMLRDAGRARRYAIALRRAYVRIGADCAATQGDLAARARATAADLPRPAPRRPRRLARREAPSFETGSAPARPVSTPRASAAGPGVSVVIPAHDRAHVIGDAIASVLSQDFTDFEVIVVDDGSADETGAVVAGIDDARLRYIRLPQNRGASAARNRGVAEARGDLVAFLDSDDIWRPGKLAAQVARMRALPERVGLCYTGTETVAQDARHVAGARREGAVFEPMLLRNLLHGGPSSALIRRAVFDMVGGFDESFPAIEDYDLWLRICRFWEVTAIDAPMVVYRDQAMTAAGGGARVSRNVEANLAARRMLERRYAFDRRRLGVDHLFRLETARRSARQGRHGLALRQMLGLARDHPLRYAALARAAFPALLRRGMRRGRARPDET